MPSLDSRLLQLFETLVASNADWLIFELIEGIEAGVVLEETADDLASARILARQVRESPRPIERIAVSPESRPLEGDEQVAWAARYIGSRLEEALALMDASVERLNKLVDRQGDIGIKGRRASVTLGLGDEDEVITVTSEGRTVAQLAVFDLLAALDSWIRDVTGGRQAP